jgi:soluble lytic murein transglycosylase-like protein
MFFGRWPSYLLGCLLLISQQMAHADVWGYIDEKGVAHFAAERLDERYEIFFRGGESFDTSRTARGVIDTPRAVALPAANPKLLAFFDISPSFKQVKHFVREAADLHKIDFELLQALIVTESGFSTSIVSPKGAVGLMQIMPDTARRFGVDSDRWKSVEAKLTDPKTNIKVGSRYLRDLINMFPGQLELALASYNAGEGAVQRAGNKIPNYKETQDYVKTVLSIYQALKPPAALMELRQRPPGRVRMELPGGATGRGNMVQPLVPPSSPAATPSPSPPLP